MYPRGTGKGIMNRPSFAMAALVGLLASLLVSTACSSPAVGKHHHHSKSPRPTTASPTVPDTGSPAPAPTGTGGLVVLHDPGHVTYDRKLAAGQCHASSTTPDTSRPDGACTPGGIDPAVTPATLHSTICVSGYTKTVRPPVSETGPLKRAQYVSYGIPTGTVSELDHLVPLELGGNNTLSNLWPEQGPTSGNPKDQVENDLHAAVCSGKVQLLAAQQAIASDWTTAEHVLGLK